MALFCPTFCVAHACEQGFGPCTLGCHCLSLQAQMKAQYDGLICWFRIQDQLGSLWLSTCSVIIVIGCSMGGRDRSTHCYLSLAITWRKVRFSSRPLPRTFDVLWLCNSPKKKSSCGSWSACSRCCDWAIHGILSEKLSIVYRLCIQLFKSLRPFIVCSVVIASMGKDEKRKPLPQPPQAQSYRRDETGQKFNPGLFPPAPQIGWGGPPPPFPPFPVDMYGRTSTGRRSDRSKKKKGRKPSSSYGSDSDSSSSSSRSTRKKKKKSGSSGVKKKSARDLSPGYAKYKAERKQKEASEKAKQDADVLANALVGLGYSVRSGSSSTVPIPSASSCPGPPAPVQQVQGTENAQLSKAQIALLEFIVPGIKISDNTDVARFVTQLTSNTSPQVNRNVKLFLESHKQKVPRRAPEKASLLDTHVKSLM
eukprot:TRINITY_DN36749_c0_g1_i1.p1 TRINITY_DN36749_c0_g1~~TRINITY_DN36749_c0_g1_i1.p1  ORF type:complete len:422 (+),score=23.87 TRINITY_DN36749_c0_g1_i1:387-1652(+)